MSKHAIILHKGGLGQREVRLSRILDFFGVPWSAVEISSLGKTGRDASQFAVFGSVQLVAAALKNEVAACFLAQADSFYAYPDETRETCTEALRSLSGNSKLTLQDPPGGELSLRMSGELADLTGPMTGLQVKVRLRSEDAVLTGDCSDKNIQCTTVISAEGASVFVRFQQGSGSPIFFCTSSDIVDVEQSVNRSFYDVKEHFCSVVPLVMFIRFMFQEVVWRPQELGACLIIDDPLLEFRYGFCDFVKLLQLMSRHKFTTNIAFIPWNWRRTSAASGEFFRNASRFFSVSIHGCDHTGGEFGTTSIETLRARAQMANRRMQNHEARTGIQHDPVMVFPQGVFSSACPEVLKHNGFISAVNTELVPADSQNARTRISDVWDLAIMGYGEFPIFTRRYPFHGLENFAFDLLLGKPCLIVAHHDFFKDGGAQLIELIEKIQSLNCCLRWRSLGEVIRRACRQRTESPGKVEVRMYGSELLVGNPLDQAIEVKIRKRKSNGDLVTEILCGGLPIDWMIEDNNLVFVQGIPANSEKTFHVSYQKPVQDGLMRRSLRFELSVGLRRILSEFRDNYLSRSPFLTTHSQKLKRVLKRAI